MVLMRMVMVWLRLLMPLLLVLLWLAMHRLRPLLLVFLLAAAANSAGEEDAKDAEQTAGRAS